MADWRHYRHAVFRLQKLLEYSSPHTANRVWSFLSSTISWLQFPSMHARGCEILRLMLEACRASGVAAAGAAVAFYLYSRKLQVCGFGGNPQEGQATSEQHFEGTYQAPSTWIEALYFFAEALRWSPELPKIVATLIPVLRCRNTHFWSIFLVRYNPLMARKTRCTYGIGSCAIVFATK